MTHQEEKNIPISKGSETVRKTRGPGMWRLAWQRFKRNKTGVFGLVLVLIVLFFAMVGSVMFGGGYVLVAYLEGGLVDVEPQLMTQQQLLDAIAIGQLTPGPLFTTATFLGYLMAGVPGAVSGRQRRHGRKPARSAAAAHGKNRTFRRFGVGAGHTGRQ